MAKKSEAATKEKPAEKAAEVSTGNTGTNGNGNGATEKVVVARRESAPDTVIVTVDQLDPNWFSNPRGVPFEHKIREMRNDIKANGQLQNIGGVELPTGKIAVYFGWTRTEAITRNVVEPLIHRYNKDNNLESTDPKFLIVSKPEHRAIAIAAYPDDFNTEKNKDRNKVAVALNRKIKPDDRGAAMQLGVIENTKRQEMSLLQCINAMEKMINEFGVTQGAAGESINVSKSVASLYRKINKMPDQLRKFLVTPEEGESIPESDLAKLKERVDAMVNEMIRRMDLLGEEDQISYSHLRELAGRVVKDEGEKRDLTRAQTMDLLASLVGADPKNFRFIGAKEIDTTPDGKIVEKSTKPPETYTLWFSRLNAYVEETAKRRAGIAVPAPATEQPTSAEVAASPEAQGATTGTVEGLAAQQAAQAVSTGNEPTPGPAEAAAEANANVPTVGTGEATATATAEQPTGPSTEDIAASLVGGAGSAEGLDDDVDEPLTGEKATKSVVAPMAQVKVKEPHVIQAAIETLKATLQEAETDDDSEKNCGLIAANLGAIALGYSLISRDAESAEYHEAQVEYSEELEQYVQKLENFVEKACKDSKGKLKFIDERPQVPALVFSGIEGNDEFADRDAPPDIEAFGDDEGDAPTDDDLSAIEGEE